MKIILTKIGWIYIKDSLLENEMQQSSMEGTGKLYESMFSEFIRLYFYGIRNKSNYPLQKVRVWVKGKTTY